jgi:hypothetical protein
MNSSCAAVANSEPGLVCWVIEDDAEITGGSLVRSQNAAWNDVKTLEYAPLVEPGPDAAPV